VFLVSRQVGHLIFGIDGQQIETLETLTDFQANHSGIAETHRLAGTPNDASQK